MDFKVRKDKRSQVVDQMSSIIERSQSEYIRSKEIFLKPLEKQYESFKEECKKHYRTIRFYNNEDLTYEEERLLRVRNKYEKYKLILGLSDNSSFEITEEMVNKLWETYLYKEKGYEDKVLDLSNANITINWAVDVDNYVTEMSNLIHNSKGKIVGYSPTPKKIEELKFVVSVDVIIALIVLEDIYKDTFNSIFGLLWERDNSLMRAIRHKVENSKLTEEGRNRAKAVINMLLPEELQPIEFKELLKQKGFN